MLIYIQPRPSKIGCVLDWWRCWTNTVGFGPRPGLPVVPFPSGSSFETVSPKKLQCKDGGRFRQQVAESYSSNRKSCNFGSKSCYSVTKLVFATQPKGVRNPGQQPLGRFICWLLLVLVPKQRVRSQKKSVVRDRSAGIQIELLHWRIVGSHYAVLRKSR